VYCLPQGLPFVLELSPSVLFPMLVRLVGGPDDGASQPASSPTLSLQPVRPFTRIEQALVGSITSRVLDALRETWAPRLPDVRFDVAESEHNPLLMQVVGPSEPSVVLACEVSVGQNAGRTHISLPARSFKGVLDILTRSGVRSGSQAGGNTETERQRIRDHLSQAEITMVAEFDPLPLELSDVLALRPGDIIDTEIRRGAEVSVLVEGKRLFRGVPVSLDGRRAIQLRGDEPRPPS
jgi:flagellar motor switch protein FliM